MTSVDDANFFIRKRYFVCFLTFTGTMILYILRTNFSIALVEMTSSKNITSGNITYTKAPDFDWDTKTKGFVLSVFSIGYLFGPFGGILALKFGGVTIFGVGVAITALLTVLSPYFLRINFFLFIFARTVEGVFESFSVASLSDIFVYWAPPKERSRLLVFNIAGGHLGAAVNYPISGYIAYHYGWEAVFYVTGGFVFVWYAIWLASVSNDPTTDPLMTQKERNYFQSFSPATIKEEKIDIPWRKLFSSKPFWALVNEYFSNCWSLSFLTYCLPIYVKDSFKAGIDANGLLSGVPTAVGFLGSIVSSFLLDYLRNRGKFTQPFLHRVFIASGQILFVVFMMYTALFANLTESIIFFSLARFVQEFAATSYFVLLIDMFSKYAGVVRGFTATAVSVSFFLNPIVMGFMVSDHSLPSWNLYFLFLCIFNIWGLAIYYFYGSGELQEWAAPKTAEKFEKI